MAESFSTVTVVGALRREVQVDPLPSGTVCGVFELILRERTSAGQWFSTIVPCQLYGKHVDAARALLPGQACLFQGKLAKRKRGETWEPVVSGFSLEPFDLPAPVPAAASVSRN